jgi:hypothetical protein
MLSAGGTLGESAKRLLASSLVVSLDPRPETLGKDAFLAGHEAPALPVERPKEDRSPGQLVVAALKRSRAVVTLALAPLAFVIRRLGSKRPDAIADDAVLAGALGGLEIAGIVLAVVIAASGFSAKPAESIAKQIDAVTPPDARVLFDKTVSMREGEKAQVLAFGQRDRSSILRIYSLGAIADGSEKLSLEPRNEPRQFFFLDRPQLVDIDDNGSREMLLRYVTAVGGGRNLTIPVLVVRAGEDQFTAWPLLQTRPRYAGGRAARRHMDAFGTRFDLGPKLRSGFGVTSAIPVPGLSLLVTASELDTTRDHARLAIALYEVEITNRAVSATLACSARHPGGIVVAVAPRAFDSDYTGYLKSTYRSLVPQLSGGGEKGKCPSKPVLPSAATSF